MTDLTVVRPAPTALERLVDDYLMACRARGLSRNTIETSYDYPLRSILLPWCADHGIQEIVQFDRRAVDAFSVALRETPQQARAPPLGVERPCLPSGRPRLPRLVRERGREGRSAAATAPAAAPCPRRPRSSGARAAHRGGGDRARPADTQHPRRLRTRNEEVCALAVGDVVRRDRQAFLHIHGKGGRERLVPLPPPLLRGLERYQRHGRPADARSDRLFLGLRRGLSGEYEPLTRSGS